MSVSLQKGSAKSYFQMWGKSMRLKKTLTYATGAAAAMLMAGTASATTIFHHDPAVGFQETFRSAGSAPMGRLTVDSAITISSFGVLADINGDSDLQFLIFDADTGVNLFTSAIQSFTDVGEDYYFSNPLNFTFNVGTTYSVGASSSNGASYRLDELANSVGGFNFLTGNQNLRGPFGSSTLDQRLACCDVATAFVIADRGAVPEPATWAFMIFGFGAVGSALRTRRRKVTFQTA
jgi:hypothetical protein